jgi:AcrR family transcriptional regulator
MPNKGDRGGSKTRAHIAAVATQMFLERGFDEVTIAEVASAANVSKVTVFAHFERKEDLLFDQLPDAVEIVRSAIRNRATGTGVVESLRDAALFQAEQENPLSVLNPGIEPFIRMILDSAALVGRLRLFAHEIETAIAAELEMDAAFLGDSALVAALVVAAYRVVAVKTIRRRLAGDSLSEIILMHQTYLDECFDAVAEAISIQRSVFFDRNTAHAGCTRPDVSFEAKI